MAKPVPEQIAENQEVMKTTLNISKKVQKPCNISSYRTFTKWFFIGYWI